MSLSLAEIFSVAIAGRYEYFISKNHSIGAHLSIYVYGRNTIALGSEHDYYPVFHGFKLAPAYRYYPGKKRRIFLEGKIPVGYYHFSKLEYHYGYSFETNIKYSFWTTGFGASVGIVIPLKRTKTGIITVSAGYQYFPTKAPEEIEVQQNDGTLLRYETNNYWWYHGGPGSVLDIKILIGGLF